MFKLIRAFKNASKFNKANTLCRVREYQSAYLTILDIDISNIKTERFIEYSLLRGFIAYQIGDFEDAANCCEVVFEYTNKAINFNTDERAYIEAYCAIFYSNIIYKVKTITSPKDIALKITYDNINLDKVNKKLKKLYPLRSHPNWEAEY